MEETIEERIWKKLDEKRLLISSTVDDLAVEAVEDAMSTEDFLDILDINLEKLAGQVRKGVSDNFHRQSQPEKHPQSAANTPKTSDSEPDCSSTETIQEEHVTEERKVLRPLKLFISYAHKDEKLKDELIVMLKGMQRRGIIDAWQDRLIEAGDEWYQSIQTAMNECDVALLLVSPNFIASNFIHNEEIPYLLQRRQSEGMRVIPIIIRPCTWTSEPILKDLQALPRDGKAVITFSEENGDRDQAWTDIAKVIEKRAKSLWADR